MGTFTSPISVQFSNVHSTGFLTLGTCQLPRTLPLTPDTDTTGLYPPSLHPLWSNERILPERTHHWAVIEADQAPILWLLTVHHPIIGPRLPLECLGKTFLVIL